MDGRQDDLSGDLVFNVEEVAGQVGIETVIGRNSMMSERARIFSSHRSMTPSLGEA